MGAGGVGAPSVTRGEGDCLERLTEGKGGDAGEDDLGETHTRRDTHDTHDTHRREGRRSR